MFRKIFCGVAGLGTSLFTATAAFAQDAAAAVTPSPAASEAVYRGAPLASRAAMLAAVPKPAAPLTPGERFFQSPPHHAA